MATISNKSHINKGITYFLKPHPLTAKKYIDNPLAYILLLTSTIAVLGRIKLPIRRN